MELQERKHTVTGAPIGMVDKQGVCRFASGDINECRAFLRGLGLEIGPNPRDGWRKTGWLGLIEFWDGKWNAAAWKSPEIVWTGDQYLIGRA